jgi:rhodanese-related sulfurtransferase
MPDALPLEVSCQEVHGRIARGDELVLLDCREPDEHELVAIAGAVLLPMSQLIDRQGELEPLRSRHVVVYCHLGGRSLRVASWLRQQGLATAQSLAGGIDQWAVDIEPGLPRY